MSRIPELGEHYSKLPDILSQYEHELTVAEGLVKIEGKTLETANRENPSWQLYYDQKKIEIGTLAKYFDAEVQRVRSVMFKSYKENYSRELSEREINKYIDHEKKYLDIYEIYLEIKELYEKYESVVEAFKARGYALNNITKARIAEVYDATI